jgi:Tfp pilus assembly protein PilX
LNKKGIALYLVLMVLLVVIIFANIILSLVSSQSSLTTHQTKRIQAFYAAQAGINYALEALRINDTNWTGSPPFNSNITHYMCRSNTTGFPCDANLTNSANITEPSLPTSINYIQIVVGPFNATTGSRQVTSIANYSR